MKPDFSAMEEALCAPATDSWSKHDQRLWEQFVREIDTLEGKQDDPTNRN